MNRWLIIFEDKEMVCGCEYGFTHVKIFSNIKSIMNFLLENHNCETEGIYNLPALNKGIHCAEDTRLAIRRFGRGWHWTQLDFYQMKIRNREYRTRDNGSGKLEWYRYK